MWSGHATRRLAARCGGAFLAASASASRHPKTWNESSNYWEHSREEFDVYISNPTADDLPVLLREFQSGREVWPWIWTQPNESGPHHVFVGINTHILDEIRKLLDDAKKQEKQVNVLIVVADERQLRGVSPELLDHCGVVLNEEIKLINSSHKMLMLGDERVISFDRLTVV